MSELDLDLTPVKDGELIKWDKAGMEILGVLKAYRVQKTPKGDGNLYEVTIKGGTVAFFAPTDLHRKLSGIPVGHIVKVVYDGEVKTNSGNDMKKFSVASGKAEPAKLAALGIELLEPVGEKKPEVEEDPFK